MTATPSTTVTNGNVYIDSLLWGGWYWQDTSIPPGDPVEINYYLAGTWTSSQAASISAALATWARVANITFTRTADASSAQLIERLVGGAQLGAGTLGEHGTPEGADSSGDYDGSLLLGRSGRAYGYFNVDEWSSGGLARGGYDFLTFVHELGHGLGLAHPHDRGGGSDLFPGVTLDNSSDTGSYGLNQGLYTVMSYNDGWYTRQNPYGHGLTRYGYEAGPMAFDIAAIQHLYGANTSYHAGNDVYRLPASNGAGTFWYCIWDAGGTDTIASYSSRNTVIDLRAATLDESATGGGVPSYAGGIYGGVTIASGVVIENASSGYGNDRLTGNDADNRLSASRGNDVLRGGNGDDVLIGGAGNDGLSGGGESVNGDTVVYSSASAAVRVYLAYGGRQNTIGDGYDTLSDIENVSGSRYNDRLYGSSENNVLSGGSGNDTLAGYGGNDTLIGGNGNDVLVGGDESDLLTGGAGRDAFRFNATIDPADVDTITDFTIGADRIQIENAVFTAFASAGSLAASSFALLSAIQDINDFILYDDTNGDLYYDADGSDLGAAVRIAILTGAPGLSASDILII